MKRNTSPLYLWMLIIPFALSFVQAQEENTTIDSRDDISENLDLEAVASIFAEAEDLAEFEEMLNDPDAVISNLDLNEDDLVDYLRVMESAEEDTHVVAIQAVLDEDVYQDVATIEVEKDEAGEEHVQIVGDVYVYGPSYIIEPVYVYRPPIFTLWWRPFYRPYRSVYYWGYYPRIYRPWRPWPLPRYRSHVSVHIGVGLAFNYTNVRYSRRAVAIHTPIRRNDFAVRYPQRAHSVRVTNVTRANGTQVRTAAVNKPNGTNKRALGINQADGDKYRAAGVNHPDGTKKRVAGVNKADGTKKRAVSVERPNGSRKTVAVKKNPDGSKRAASVTKRADGNRSVKTAGKRSNTKAKRKRGSKKKGKRRGRRKS